MNRHFKGVWIPRSLYLDKNLTPTDKILLAEIDSLDAEDGCIASNQYLAEFLGVEEGTLRNLLTKLKKAGRIVVVKGESRRIYVDTPERSIRTVEIPVSTQKGQKDPVSEKGIPFAKIRDLYNELCPSFPRIRSIEGKRKQAVSGRWNSDPKIETFEELFEKAEASDFLSGRSGDKNKWATFDWLMTPTYFSKVLEGKYDNDDDPDPEEEEDTKKRFTVKGFE